MNLLFIYRSDFIIGIDLHGVIDHDLPTFKSVLANLVDIGKEVWVISGPPTKEIEAELERYAVIKGRHYHRAASVVDYLKSKNTKMWTDKKNTWWANDEDWWSAKGNICKDNGITLLIDDNGRYIEGLPEDKSIRLIIYKKGVWL